MSHPSDKAELAKWMGYDNVEQMDAEHDGLHYILTQSFNLPSYSLAIANGLELSHEEWMIANYEEDAVLYLQRWLQHIRKFRKGIIE
jgi:hypothetical protein